MFRVKANYTSKLGNLKQHATLCATLEAAESVRAELEKKFLQKEGSGDLDILIEECLPKDAESGTL